MPLYRAGFPQFDRMGAPAKVSVGYRGSRQVLFDLANLTIEAEPGAIAPYRSIYAQDGAGARGAGPDGATTTAVEGM